MYWSDEVAQDQPFRMPSRVLDAGGGLFLYKYSCRGYPRMDRMSYNALQSAGGWRLVILSVGFNGAEGQGRTRKDIEQRTGCHVHRDQTEMCHLISLTEPSVNYCELRQIRRHGLTIRSNRPETSGITNVCSANGAPSSGDVSPPYCSARAAFALWTSSCRGTGQVEQYSV